jgi:hypothetical protein
MDNAGEVHPKVSHLVQGTEGFIGLTRAGLIDPDSEKFTGQKVERTPRHTTPVFCSATRKYNTKAAIGIATSCRPPLRNEVIAKWLYQQPP